MLFSQIKKSTKLECCPRHYQAPGHGALGYITSNKILRPIKRDITAMLGGESVFLEDNSKLLLP